ncbi:MAG: hypothetical protein PHS49_02775 [Candidatus Gracilibacteria bacterium]|nr:hypothetical protein [Candidatus Gracilibacteria bacterium]
MKTNDLMNTFLLKNNEEVGPNKISYTKTAIDLQNLSKSLVKDTLDGKIILTTGVGLDDVGVPVRSPALIIPALEIIRYLQKIGINDVNYLIYQATGFIINENGLNINNANQVSSFMKKYFELFIQEFYYDIYDKIILNFNFELEQNYLDKVSLNITKLGGKSYIDSLIKNLENYASSKGKSNISALQYSSANIICNGHILDIYPFDSNNVGVLLPIGGKKEKPFFNLGKIYEENFSDNNDYSILNIPLLQKTGEIPAYFTTKGEDYVSSEYDYIELSGENINSSVEFDRNIVLAKFGKNINFNQLIKNILG